MLAPRKFVANLCLGLRFPRHIGQLACVASHDFYEAGLTRGDGTGGTTRTIQGCQLDRGSDKLVFRRLSAINAYSTCSMPAGGNLRSNINVTTSTQIINLLSQGRKNSNPTYIAHVNSSSSVSKPSNLPSRATASNTALLGEQEEDFRRFAPVEGD